MADVVRRMHDVWALWMLSKEKNCLTSLELLERPEFPLILVLLAKKEACSSPLEAFEKFDFLLSLAVLSWLQIPYIHRMLRSCMSCSYIHERVRQWSVIAPRCWAVDCQCSRGLCVFSVYWTFWKVALVQCSMHECELPGGVVSFHNNPTQRYTKRQGCGLLVVLQMVQLILSRGSVDWSLDYWNSIGSVNMWWSW